MTKKDNNGNPITEPIEEVIEEEAQPSEEEGQEETSQDETVADEAEDQADIDAKGLSPLEIIRKTKAAAQKKAEDAAVKKSGQAPQAEGGDKGDKSGKKTVTAPNDWPQEDKDAFSSLPDNTKQQVLRFYKNFQADYTKKTQEIAMQRKDLESIARADKRFKDIPSVTSYIKDALAFEQALKTNPVGTILHLAKMQGVNLSPEVSQAIMEDAGVNPMDTILAPLQSKIADLESQLVQQTAQPIEDEIGQFAAATDEEGNLKYPLFEKLAPIMGYIMKRDGHSDLTKAYDEALLTIPEEREKKLAADRVKLADGIKKQQDAAKAKKAQAAKAPGNGNPPPPATVDFKGLSPREIIKLTKAQLEAK